MRRRWTIEADYPDSTRPASVDGQLQALLDLFTSGRARIVEAFAVESQDTVEAGDEAAEVLVPVLRIVASS